ncbi:unnamed protein product, partial [Rotaria sp. Silwood2]
SHETHALKQLKEDRSSVILKADKGNVIVIMDKTDYMNKIKELLDDQSEFCSVNNDESAVHGSLRERKNRAINKEQS